MAITERVRLALAYLREGVSTRGLARITSIPNTTLRDNINPVLAAFDQLEAVLPDGTVIESFDDVIRWCAQEGKVIIDGTDFTVARPGDQDLQRPFYSGKRKTHTTKTIAVCDSSSNLMWVTPLVAGATHDLTALRDASLPDHLAASNLAVLADSGFQGLQNDVPEIRLPTRRHGTAKTLTMVDRFFNTLLASKRVRVEHSIGRLKQWRCLTVPNQRRDLLERWLPICLALTTFQQAWPQS